MAKKKDATPAPAPEATETPAATEAQEETAPLQEPEDTAPEAPSPASEPEDTAPEAPSPASEPEDTTPPPEPTTPPAPTPEATEDTAPEPTPEIAPDQDHEPEPVPPGERPIPYKAAVAVSLAAVHKEVGLGTADMLKAVGTLKQGAAVTVTGRKGTYAQLKNGLYISEAFLEVRPIP